MTAVINTIEVPAPINCAPYGGVTRNLWADYERRLSASRPFAATWIL